MNTAIKKYNPINKLLIVAAFSISSVFIGCKKDEPVKNGSVEIEFSNVVDGIGLQYATNYQNESGEIFTVSMFKYYISNIKLTTTEGTIYAVPESYYLINQDIPDSKKIILNDIPAGTYNKIEYTIGVDKARNTSGTQTGALDPIYGMFWDWNSGYIFLKMEGLSAAAPGGNLSFHIGGINDPLNCIKTVSPSLGGQTFNVDNLHTPSIHYLVDLIELFKSPTTISFTTMNSVAGGADSKVIADNYVDMISLYHLHP